MAEGSSTRTDELRHLDDQRSAQIWSLYFQDEYSIRKNLAFTLGLRDDQNSRYGNTLSPRAGFLVRPTRNTDIRAIYSWAFRAPNGYETFYTGTGNSSNPTLRPEKIRTWEVDVDHRFGKTYFISGAAFLNRMDNLIDHTLDPASGHFVFANSVPLQAKGIEWEAGARWAGGWEGVISHSMQSSENIVTNNVLTNSPKNVGKASLSIPLAWKSHKE